MTHYPTQTTIGGIDREDDGTPATGSGNSLTVPLDGDYDEVEVFVEITDTGGSGNNLDVQVDGVTTATYDYIDESGAKTTGASNWPHVATVSGNGTSHAHFAVGMYGANAGAVLTNLKREAQTALLASGITVDGSIPLSQITLLRGASTDWKVRVVGRNLY